VARDARGGLDAQKKRLIASERDPLERAAWRTMAERELRTEDLVFVDESGASRALCALYGWAPRGQAACGSAPRNRGPNTSLLAAMSAKGLLGSLSVEGSVDREVFVTYLDQVLCPALRPGQVVILDNLSVHKGPEVLRRIEARGCRLVFLPAYSPDFNPIEGAFSKLKAFLRRAQARTQRTLENALAKGLARITAADAAGWFAHCGFPITQPS
jgi:transposase